MIVSPFTSEEIVQFFFVYVADSQFISSLQYHFSNLLWYDNDNNNNSSNSNNNDDTSHSDGEGGVGGVGGEAGVTSFAISSTTSTSTSTSTNTSRKIRHRYKLFAIMGILSVALVISISSSFITHSSTKNNDNGGGVGDGDSIEHIDSATTTTIRTTRRLNASETLSSSSTSKSSSKSTSTKGKKKSPTRIGIETVDGIGEIVIAVGVSNDIRTYKQFIGSLRHSGFNGTIILGRPVNDNVRSSTSTSSSSSTSSTSTSSNNDNNDKSITTYLHSQKNIIIHPMEITKDDCHGQLIVEDQGEDRYNRNVCVRPYTNLKLGWTGHALAKDWLKEYCSTSSKMAAKSSSSNSSSSSSSSSSDSKASSNSNNFGSSCNGLVLLSPLKNVFFQRNPFTNIHPPTASATTLSSSQFLYLYEDHPSKTINDNFALLQCKKFQWDVPYLKSIAMGDVSSMQFYLEHIVTEAYEWMDKSECYLSNTGIAIQNFLFYNGIIQATYVFPHRTDIVNSVGALVGTYLTKKMLSNGIEVATDGGNDGIGSASGATSGASELLEWENIFAFLLNEEYIDSDGNFLNADGTISTIIHQLDVFGESFDNKWLMKQPFMEFMEDGNKEINGGSDATYSEGRNNVDNPLDNPLYYLSLESSLSGHHYIDTTYLRKRKVMGRVEYDK